MMGFGSTGDSGMPPFDELIQISEMAGPCAGSILADPDFQKIAGVFDEDLKMLVLERAMFQEVAIQLGVEGTKEDLWARAALEAEGKDWRSSVDASGKGKFYETFLPDMLGTRGLCRGVLWEAMFRWARFCDSGCADIIVPRWWNLRI